MILPLPHDRPQRSAARDLQTLAHKQGWLRPILALVLSILIGHAHAETSFEITGFGTAGLAVEREDNVAFLRDNNQSKDPEKDASALPDSLLGAQFSARYGTDWRATTQFVYRDRPKQALKESTELAFLGYRPIPDLDIRAGRVAFDAFQLSDYRRVDYANLWIRPPTEVYGFILPYYVDGGDIAYSLLDGENFWRFKLQYGKSEPLLQIPQGTEIVRSEFDDIFVGTLSFDRGNWRSRLSYVQSDLAPFAPMFGPLLHEVANNVPGPIGEEAAELAVIYDRSYQVRYWQASVGYDDGDLIADLELVRLTASGGQVPSGKAGYLSLGHRIGDFTPYIVYSRFISDEDVLFPQNDWSGVPQGPLLQALAIENYNGVLVEQFTHSLGMRWDFAPKFALKVQWDRSYITAGKYSLWAHDNGRAARSSNINVFSTALNFLF